MGPLRDSPEIDPLAVLHLDNRLYIITQNSTCNNYILFKARVIKSVVSAKYKSFYVMASGGLCSSTLHHNSQSY